MYHFINNLLIKMSYCRAKILLRKIEAKQVWKWFIFRKAFCKIRLTHAQTFDRQTIYKQKLRIHMEYVILTHIWSRAGSNINFGLFNRSVSICVFNYWFLAIATDLWNRVFGISLKSSERVIHNSRFFEFLSFVELCLILDFISVICEL